MNGNIQITVSAINNPSSQSATRDGTVPTSEIDVAWSKNAQSHNVMVLSKLSSDSWTEPTQGSSYSAGNSIGSGTVVYNGSATSASATSLTADRTYDFKFYSVNNNYYSSGVTAQTNTLASEPASSPSSLTFSSVGTTTMTIGWGGVSTQVLVAVRASSDLGAEPADQTVYTANSTFGSGTALGSGFVVYKGNGTSVAISGLTAGTVYYVRVYNMHGGAGTDNYRISDELSGNRTTLSAEPTSQAATVAFASISSSGMTVSWSGGDGAGSLVVARLGEAPSATPTDGTTYTASGTFGSGTALGGGYVVYAGSAASFSLAGLTAGTNYHLQVFEYNGSGASINYMASTASGNPGSKYALCASPTPSATDGTDLTKVAVTWSAATGALGATGKYAYTVDDDSDPASPLTTGNTDNLNYDHSSATPGQLYYYWIRARNTDNTLSAYGTYDTGYRKLATVSITAATDGTDTTKVGLTWSDTTGETGYGIYRHTANVSGSASYLGAAAADATSYDDSSATPGQQYYYWVRATNTTSASQSDFQGSGEGGYRKLATVADLDATDDTYPDKVVLTWTDGTGETGYGIWRHTADDSGAADYLAAVVADEETYEDTSATAGVPYFYWVRATNSTSESLSDFQGSGEPGSRASLTVPLLTTPSFSSILTNGATLGATLTTNGGAAVTSRGTVWNTTGDPVTENGAAEGDTADGAFSHARTGMPEGTLIYFRGYAVNSQGTGYSPSSSFWTVPKAPALGAAAAFTNASFAANWSAATGATNYLLDASISATFASFVDGYQDRVAGNATTFSVTGLTAGTTYYWRLRAQNSGGISVYSATNTALTVPDAPEASASTGWTTSLFDANWAASVGATSYRLDVSTLVGFGSFVSGWENANVGDVTTYDVNSSLSAGTVYYYRLRAVNASGSSSNSATITAYTLSAEPAGHVGSFAAAPASTSSINLTWTAAAGPPSGYLILQRTGAAPTGTPGDGTGYSVGNSIGDGTVAAIVTPGSSESVTISSLSAGTAYYFVIVPFAWNGANAQTYNYRTASAPGANATTVYAEPGTQASSVIFSSVGTSGLTVEWTSGNGANRLVVAHAGAAVDAHPADMNAYAADASFGSGDEIGTDNFVVYSGSGSSVAVSGLSADTVYHFRVYEFNGSGVTANYNANTASGNPASRTTMAAEPTANPSSATITAITATGFTISWSGGDGANSIVLVKSGGAVDAAPADQATYTASATFGSGSEIGTGNRVVYKGSGASVDVTGLSAGTTYHVAVYEYNGSSAGAENYFTTGPATDSDTTLSAEPTQATTLTFSSIGKDTITVGWTGGDGANLLLLAHEGAAVDAHPADGAAYTANGLFGAGTELGTGNFVVYSGAGASGAVTGLKTNTTYHFQAYEYNGSGGTLNYNTNTASGNPASQATWNLAPGISQGGGLAQSATVGTSPATQTLTITNIGLSQLSFDITDDVGWLSLSAGSGGPLNNGATASFTVTYTVAGLGAGVSNATITVTSTGTGANVATNSPITIPVALTLSAIADPTAGTATADGKEMVDLAWTPHGSYSTVLILRKTSAITTDPSPNTSYSEGGTIDGATVIYKGTATAREHVVAEGSANYYKFYSVNNNHYSAGIAANVTLGSYVDGTLVETFSYTNAGTLATSGQGNGGQGWGGAWSSDTSDFSISSGNFANQANYPNAAGNKVKVTIPDSGSKKVFRALDQTYKDGRLYFSYIMNYQFEGAGKYAGLSLFYDTADEKLFVGEIGTQDQQLGIDATGSARALTKGSGNDYIIIGYYDWVNAQAKARAYKIGTDTVPTDEETSWDVTVSKASNTVGWVNSIRLAAGANSGGTPGDVYFDELRVATNWAGVLGITLQQPSLSVSPTSISNTVMMGSSLSTYVFGVTNVGGGTLLYTNYITHGSGWSGASVLPANSSLGAAASRSDTVTVSSVGLAAGNYYATNRVDGNQTNTAVVISLVMTVTNIPVATSVSASPEGAELVRLGWTAPSGLQVLVVHNGTNAPTGPSPNTAYALGDSIGSDGSKVIYKGSGAALDHVVKPGSVNEYKLYAINNNHYSPAASASATVSSYLSGERVDPMAYTNGIALNSSGTGSGGQGWTNGWGGADVANWTVSSGSFANASYYPTNYGNKLTATATGADRSVLRGLPAVTGGKIYVSYILNYAANAWAGLSLYDGSTEKIFFGEAAGGANQLGISSGGESLGESLSAGPGNDYIVVGMLDLGTGEAKVESYKIGTDTVPVNEPVSWSATRSGLSISRVDGIRLAAGDGAGAVYFDEVRLATNWNELLNVTYTTPVLAATPVSGSFTAIVGANPAAQTFTVSNVGGGGDNLDYTNVVSYSPAGTWLTVTAPTGRLAATASQVHTAAVDVTGLAVGTYFATNTIFAGVGGTQVVSYTLSVGAPGSTVGPTTLYVTSSYGVVSSVSPYPYFFVTNGGSGTVNLNFSNSISYSSAAGWLTLGSPTGTLASDAVFTNTANANAGVLNPGVYTATITVNGNQTNAAPTVTVNFTVVGYRVGEIYDPFTNAVASVYTNANGGTGWTNQWRDVAAAAFAVSSGDLSAPMTYPTPQGNKLTGNPSGVEILDFRGFNAFDSGRIYVSVLVQAQNPIANSFAGVSLMNGSAEEIFIGKRWGSGQFGVEAPNSAGSAKDSSFNFGNGTYLMVGMYDFDKDYFRGQIYNSGDGISLTEPTSWQVSNAIATAVSRIDGLRLGAKDSGTSVNFDEVRVAATWEELINAAPNEPTVHAAAMRFANVTTNSMAVSWNSGSGAGRIVVAREGSAVDWSPTDGNDYTANPDFALAADQADGNKVVYNGSGTNFSFSGLTSATNYYFKVFEFNGSGASANYLTSGGVLASNRWTLLGEPANQPSGLDVQAVSSTSLTGTWTAASGSPAADGYLVLRRAGAAPTGAPEDGRGYTAGDALGDGVVAAVVSPGTVEGVLFSGLASCTSHYFKVFSFRKLSDSDDTYNYLTTSPADDNAATLCSEPSLQASNIVFGAVTTNSIELSWQNGSGEARIVVARGTNAISTVPSDQTAYAANATYGSGDPVGSVGQYVVYNGTGETATVTGLAPGVDYHFRIFDYIGSGAAANYITNTANNNPRSTRTSSIGLIEDMFADGEANLAANGGGTGWTNNWQTLDGEVNTSAGSFPSFKNYPTDSGGNKGYLNSVTERSAYRHFPQFSSGKIYIGIKVNVGNQNQNAFFGVNLRNGGGTTGFFGKAYGVAGGLLSLDHDGTQATSPLHTNTTYTLLAGSGNDYLLVGMYDFEARIFRAKGMTTNVLSHVDPSRELGWSVELTDVNISAIDGIQVIGSGMGDCYFDHIRIGSTWDEVILNLSPGHQNTGPQPRLIYIGTNYSGDVVGDAVVTNLTDAELKSANLIDFAVEWTDPDGIFLTNATATITNIGSPVGRVNPNWDPLAIGAATNEFNLDRYFTNFFGINGSTVVTTYQRAAFNVTNIDFSVDYFVTVSSEDNPSGGTALAPNGGDAVPHSRAITVNWPLRFYVSDDDTNPPVAGSLPLVVFTNGAPASFQSVGDLRRYFVTDGSLTTVGFNASFNYYDSYSGLRRDATGPVESNISVTVENLTTNNVGGYDSGKSTANGTLSTATSYWNFAHTLFTYAQVGSMYGSGALDLDIMADIPDADDDRLNDETWSSNAVLGYLRVLDDDSEAPTIASATIDYGGVANRYFSITTNATPSLVTNRSGDFADVRYTLTDGELNEANARDIRFAFGVRDAGSGIARGITGSTNTVMSFSLGNILSGNFTNYRADLSSANAADARTTNVWSFPVGFFGDALITALMVPTSNQVAITAPDNDADRPDDQMALTAQTVGWLTVVDDDEIGPAMGAVSIGVDDGLTEGVVISEYIEGSSNNKALELYNGTPDLINLAAESYAIRVYSNGSPTPSSTINLTGLLPSKGVYVVANVGASAGILSVANQTSGSFNWNGDDAVALVKGSTIVDVIGQIGFDPGTEWVNGVVSTLDKTLRRKSAVIDGDPDGSNVFDPAEEWEVYAVDTIAGLGAHNISGSGSWTNDISVAINWNSAVDASGINQYRYRPPTETNTAPSAVTDGEDNSLTTSVTFNVVGQGVLTGFVYAVDADNDRSNDRSMGGNAAFIVRIDTNPPPVLDEVTNVLDAAIDDASEIKIGWTAQSDGAVAAGPHPLGHHLSPWDSYVIYVHELVDGTEVSTSLITSANGPADLATNVTGSVILSNLNFDSTFRVRIAGRDHAGNVGPFSVVTNQTVNFVVTQGLTRVTSVASTSNQVEVSWMQSQTATVYDVLYTDSPALQDNLTNTWKLMSTVTNSWMFDNGGTSPDGITRIGPALNQHTMRFYRVSRKGSWRTNETTRRASREVYAAKPIRLVSGENWVSIFGIPDTSTVAYVLGTNRLQGGTSVLDSPKITWFRAGNVGTNLAGEATNIIYQTANSGWQYSVGGSGSANGQLMPLGQGFLLELPVGAPTQTLVVIAQVPTQAVVQAISGGSSASPQYNVLSVNFPQRTPISQAGFVGSGMVGNTARPLLADEIRILNNQHGMGSLESPKAGISLNSDGTWRYRIAPTDPTLFVDGVIPTAGNYIIEPDDTVLVIRRTAGTMYWTNRPTYTAPGKNINP